jgi:hypothetical protein
MMDLIIKDDRAVIMKGERVEEKVIRRWENII